MPRHISRRELLTKLAPGAALASGGMGVLSSASALPSAVAFYHGVASGDPTQSELIIWTRVTSSLQSVDVVWEVAADDQFSSIVKTGELQATAQTDYTIKVDVTGLQAATQYFYRFIAAQQNGTKIESGTGKAKTLPVGDVSSFKMAVCSCSNYPAGYFHAYAEMAAQSDLDLVVHLGDYIYEYDADGYASSSAEALGRVSEPLNEVTELSDFRRRHAQYKSDKNLQALHAAYPFILSWDDHEFADNAWTSGAGNHDTGEGEWDQRKAAAVQAYYEWMPIRAPKERSLDQQWRNFQIGSLASLTILETRVSARDEQVDVGADMLYVQARFAMDASGNAVRLAEDENSDNVESFDLPFEFSDDDVQPIEDYQRIRELAKMKKLPEGIAYQPDMKTFRSQVLNDPERQLLGDSQRRFISEQIQNSKASGTTWQLFGNQTLVAKIDMPNLADKLTTEELDQVVSWFRPSLGLTRYQAPFGTDSWNGYGAEREWFLQQVAEHDANAIVLTGDTHAGWGIELQAESNDNWKGVEIGCTSISSPGLPEALGIDSGRMRELLLETNENLKYSETSNRGYTVLELSPENAVARFHKISTVHEREFKTLKSDELKIKPRAKENGAGIELELS